MFSGAVNAAADTHQIVRLISSEIGEQVHLPCLFDNRRVKLHIGSAASHSIKSPPEIEKAE